MRYVSSFAAFIVLPFIASAQYSGNVQATTLKNGLKLLVQEDHTIPTVALYFFYRTGSRNERPGITGLSHFFEHMMFNGSAKYGPGEFDRIMEQNGGENNAYTTKDDTVYTDWFPRESLELLMKMEADRMEHLSLDPKTIENERGAVYSERRQRVDNDNFGALFEQVTAAAIIAHTYHWPVIGWPSDIEAWTRADLVAYYRQGYAPNNCIMVVTGDVRTRDVLELARRHFESIPSHDTFGEPRTKEPEQEGARTVTVKKEAELPLLLFAYHMPPSRSTDDAAMQVLETLLSSGDSSRLHARLVDAEQAALSVQVFNEPSLDPFLVFIYAEPRAGVDPARVKSLVLEELRKISSTPASGDELRKAKNQYLAHQYREMKTVGGRANLLGTYELFYGSYQRLFTMPAEIEKLTAADIQRVAKQVFRDDNSTIGTLEPIHTAAAPTAGSGQ